MAIVLRAITTRARAASPRLSARAVAPYLFALPGMLVFLAFMIYPLLKAIQISLYNWKIMPGQASEFVGLANYGRAFGDPIFWIALRNTVGYTLVTVPSQIVLAMIIALAIESLVRGRVWFRTLYYLPVVTSWVIVSLLFKYLFSLDGPVNVALQDLFHLTASPIRWLQEPATSLPVVMGLGVWKGVGWSMVIFLAALQTIPGDLHEAAAIDGATSWQRFRHITLPALRPTIVFVLVMLVIGGFNVFISIFLITEGGPAHRTESLLTYMYHQSFDFLEFGYGASLSYLLAILIFVISFVQVRFLRRPMEL